MSPSVRACSLVSEPFLTDQNTPSHLFSILCDSTIHQLFLFFSFVMFSVGFFLLPCIPNKTFFNLFSISDQKCLNIKPFVAACDQYPPSQFSWEVKLMPNQSKCTVTMVMVHCGNRIVSG